MTPILGIAIVALAGLSIYLWQRQIMLRREAYIRSFDFPRGLFEKIRKQHPQLALKDCQLVANGLRQFFMAYLKSRQKFVSMPSQVADDLWHEFILYTRNYHDFCQKAFGTFLHHTPAVALNCGNQSNAGLRRVWWHACREDNINPRKPTRLPLLFALDAKLHIANGFHYLANCMLARPQTSGDGSTGAIYCGGDFGVAGIDGGTEGFGDDGGGFGNFSFGGDSGGDGGGDGGGCGGGGCGS